MQTPYILHVIFAMPTKDLGHWYKLTVKILENPLQLKFHDLRMPFCSKGAAS